MLPVLLALLSVVLGRMARVHLVVWVSFKVSVEEDTSGGGVVQRGGFLLMMRDVSKGEERFPRRAVIKVGKVRQGTSQVQGEDDTNMAMFKLDGINSFASLAWRDSIVLRVLNSAAFCSAIG